ncbi:hypothetical protein B841_03645 [Corynebacterium maris DSM 45190]|uniref:Secreted protein n=1 Tax=Corynebacterium maris DSM 45190 TaxID=1224163 RepID=S5ST30_9CORY|nr:hypothetical protein B841_03645 [Corynebacterium maris DSM 45190]
MLATAVALGSSSAANAEEASSAAPVQDEMAVIDSAKIVDRVRGDLAAVGVAVPGVDPELTGAVDRAVSSVLPGTRPAAQDEPGEPEAADAPDTPAEAPLRPSAGSSTSPSQWLPQSSGGDAIPAEVDPVNTDAVAQDPNYVWRNDLSSRVLAGKPQEEWVLNRAPGSRFDAPRAPEESHVAHAQGTSLYGPSTPIYVGQDTMCTLTVAGVDGDGRQVGVTASHCGEVGDQVSSADSWQLGPSGTVVSTNEYLDYAVIEFGSNAAVTRSYNGVTVNSLDSDGVNRGDVLCKQGVATGHDCATTWLTGQEAHVTQLCAMAGDSGAPVLAGDRLVGHISRSALPIPNGHLFSCRTPLQGALHAPTASVAVNPVLGDINARGGVGAGLALPEN